MDHIAPNGMKLLGSVPFGSMKSNGGLFIEGDVLYGRMRPYLNKVHRARTSGACSAEFMVFPKSDAIDSDFLAYLLHHQKFVNFSSSQSSGDRPRVDFSDLSGYEFALPPKSEQARIVSKIDELFSRIEEGEHALEQVQKLVEHYRQSVLKAAVTGELTRDWREQNEDKLESSEALLARILRARREAWEKAELEKMKARGNTPTNDRWKQKYEEPARPDTTNLPALPEGWIWVTLEHVSECLDYAREPVSAKVRASRPGDIPYYGANGQVGTIDAHLFDEPLVLVVEDETFTGRTKPFSYKIEGRAWVNNHAHVLRPTSAMSVDYLNAMLMRYPFIPLTTGTTARRKLTQKALMSAPVAVPPRLEQDEIISILDVILSTSRPMEQDAVRSLAAASSLRQTILSSAFAGGLVAQDSTDEPASILLSRNTRERGAASVKSRHERRKKTKESA
jgi:type I restriction enzyme S subunit